LKVAAYKTAEICHTNHSEFGGALKFVIIQKSYYFKFLKFVKIRDFLLF